jgi:hypothetical protein
VEEPLLNPGSVGAAFDVSLRTGTKVRLSPWAEYGIVELNSKGISIEMKRVVFDTERMTTIAAGSDSPLGNWWKDQYRSHS